MVLTHNLFRLHEEFALSEHVLRPATDWELRGMIAQMREQQVPVQLIGNGTKRALGRVSQVGAELSLTLLRGISQYEPTELVMTAAAGTLLSQVETELGAHGQMLAFEPVDIGPAIGQAAGQQTVGGVFATNASGARRIAAGAARDHILGLSGVNGHAESFRAGGRVMKNVTGYDIARTLTGSWGTLAALTEVTFKVLPWPEDAATLIYPNLIDEIANELMCSAMGMPYEISGAVHLPEELAARLEHQGLSSQGTSLTALRIENTPTSVGYRKSEVIKQLHAYGAPLELDMQDTLNFWGELRRLSVFPMADTCLWRISTAPNKGAKVVDAIRRHMAVNAYYDWSGGLIWAEVPAAADAGASDVRRAVAIHGGHATLIRAEAAVRNEVDVFQPLEPGVAKITRGIKQVFDPQRLFNPGRMYADI